MNLHFKFFLALIFTSLATYAQGPEEIIGMQFVEIPAGTTWIGKIELICPEGPDERNVPDAQRWTSADYEACEELAKATSKPGFEVAFGSFWLGKYEVTQAQWEAIMGENPAFFQDRDDSNAYPVESVTWEDVQVFIQKLNDLDQQYRYRLPTAFEWEYAAKAGTTEPLSWKATKEQAWIQDTNKGKPQRIGLMQPNAWGLYDMLGNVWEWVSDFHNGKTAPDQIPPTSGNVHVLKGGSFSSDVTNATYFFHGGGPGNGWDVGFRLVRIAK
jgi:formylglycine-generating enzyme